MTQPRLPAGKLPVALLRHLLAAHHEKAPELLVPPSVGEDAAVIGLKGGALVAAADPITLTGREIGGHAVTINANDVAVMGVRPQWFLAVVLLPVETTEADVRALFEGMQQALDEGGIVLVGGHTEITPVVSQPVVVGQMLGYEEHGRYIRTGGVRPGDAVLQVGLAPVEGAAVLANEAAARLTAVPDALLKRARDGMKEPGISVVAPALKAAALGATAMHDLTEGGLSAGLYEMAEASGLALRVDTGAALWFEPGKAICDALGADPWGVLGSGAFLAAFPPGRVAEARRALEAAGHPTALIAAAEPGVGVATRDGAALPRYEQDELSRILSGPRS